MVCQSVKQSNSIVGNDLTLSRLCSRWPKTEIDLRSENCYLSSKSFNLKYRWKIRKCLRKALAHFCGSKSIAHVLIVCDLMQVLKSWCILPSPQMASERWNCLSWLTQVLLVLSQQALQLSVFCIDLCAFVFALIPLPLAPWRLRGLLQPVNVHLKQCLIIQLHASMNLHLCNYDACWLFQKPGLARFSNVLQKAQPRCHHILMANVCQHTESEATSKQEQTDKDLFLGFQHFVSMASRGDESKGWSLTWRPDVVHAELEIWRSSREGHAAATNTAVTRQSESVIPFNIHYKDNCASQFQTHKPIQWRQQMLYNGLHTSWMAALKMPLEPIPRSSFWSAMDKSHTF